MCHGKARKQGDFSNGNQHKELLGSHDCFSLYCLSRASNVFDMLPDWAGQQAWLPGPYNRNERLVLLAYLVKGKGFTADADMKFPSKDAGQKALNLSIALNWRTKQRKNLKKRGRYITVGVCFCWRLRSQVGDHLSNSYHKFILIHLAFN